MSSRAPGVSTNALPETRFRMFVVASASPQCALSGVSMPMKRMCSPLSITTVSPSITCVTTTVGAALAVVGLVAGGVSGAAGASVTATVVGIVVGSVGLATAVVVG